MVSMYIPEVSLPGVPTSDVGETENGHPNAYSLIAKTISRIESDKSRAVTRERIHTRTSEKELHVHKPTDRILSAYDEGTDAESIDCLLLPKEIVCGKECERMLSNDWTVHHGADEPTPAAKPAKVQSIPTNDLDLSEMINIKVIATEDNLDPVNNRNPLHPFLIELQFKKGETIHQIKSIDENGYCYGVIPGNAYFGGRDRFGHFRPSMVKLKKKKKKGLRKTLAAFFGKRK